MKYPTEIHTVEIPRSPLEYHRGLDQHKVKHFFRLFFRPFNLMVLKKPLFKGLTYFMVPVPRTIEISIFHLFLLYFILFHYNIRIYLFFVLIYYSIYS